jgi:hypothetical protein
LYIEILDDIANDKIKIKDQHLFYDKKRENSPKILWEEMFKNILMKGDNGIKTIAYKYCLFLARNKIYKDLL